MLDVEVEASGGEGVVGRGGVALDQLGEDGLDEAKGHLGLGLDRGHAKHSDEGLRGLQKMSGNRFEEVVATPCYLVSDQKSELETLPVRCRT